MRKWSSSYKWFAICIVLGFLIAACGGETEKPDYSGVWKSNNGDKILTLNFNGEQKTIEMDGKIMQGHVDQVISSNAIKINVEEDESTVSTWTFQKMWNDNGSDFILILMLPDGSRNTYSRMQHS